ncbi:MAG: hypothetical protein ACO2PK_02600 [Armatimonadota bacterium]
MYSFLPIFFSQPYYRLSDPLFISEGVLGWQPFREWDSRKDVGEGQMGVDAQSGKRSLRGLEGKGRDA